MMPALRMLVSVQPKTRLMSTIKPPVECYSLVMTKIAIENMSIYSEFFSSRVDIFDIVMLAYQRVDINHMCNSDLGRQLMDL